MNSNQSPSGKRYEFYFHGIPQRHELDAGALRLGAPCIKESLQLATTREGTPERVRSKLLVWELLSSLRGVTGLPQNVEAARKEIEQHIYQRTGNMPMTDPEASITQYSNMQQLRGYSQTAKQSYSAGGSPPAVSPSFFGSSSSSSTSNAFQPWSNNLYTGLGISEASDLFSNRSSVLSGASLWSSGFGSMSCGQQAPSSQRDEGLGDSPPNNISSTAYNLMSSIWADIDAPREPEAKGVAMLTENAKKLQFMVWGGVTYSKKTPLVFVEAGVKINAAVYKDVLENVLKPRTTHKAKVVQDWCAEQLLGLITHDEWPSSSPDLNPMDYSVWAVLEKKACSTRQPNLNSLEEALLKSRNEIDEPYLLATCEAFVERLKAVWRLKAIILKTVGMP
ncbi:unnamed protein product [Heligmosomoides polygyrus]|uniref:NDC10_II domain-containing protein n=1 Tax=Heligmosomoides polygyrus TaxID=6339 RepID=A0A3P8A3Q1_HELPZ|nr:unnamed protein product [Heligmosomoides polygyrus]